MIKPRDFSNRCDICSIHEGFSKFNKFLSMSNQLLLSRAKIKKILTVKFEGCYFFYLLVSCLQIIP